MRKYMLMALAIVTMMIFVGCGQEATVEVEQEKVVGVVVENPTKGSLVNESNMVGKFEAKSSATAMAQLAVPEEILMVNYKVGDYVEKDDIIVLLDSESTDDQVENARLSYQTAVRNYNALLESVETSKANLERTQALYDSGIASKQQLEAAELQASDGQLKTVANQMTQARFAYENAQKNLDNTSVVAPISGIISMMNFEKSNLATSQNMLVVTDMSEMKVVLNITEEMLGKIGDETKVSTIIEATGQVVESKIDSVNPVADQRTGLYEVVVTVNNEEMLYKPGMFVRVNFSFVNQMSFLVPIDAILQDDQGDFVYTILDDKVVRSAVVLGEDDGEIIEILEGITVDSLLVVSGQNYITEKSAIRVVNGGE
ncbi:efflux RND transporter periplasmic adaptor subunit [Acidaminobacter sp. JC074]|uniref:efflux RND transporter periplasmic adaptor subunit n=1 Tax=Acidaminobacter sp. JC074 TaxID=2530199 RepID=UPI001F0DA6A3|nr:efflux RND transporter periplasmic adaptor subunit [Acidaminobacter sp. JC074]MCH4889665.1 efflux RND transporter periplasmic adaptor subunit [Acidaminobacter sp. JC074]